MSFVSLFRLIVFIVLCSVNPVHALELGTGQTELDPTPTIEYLEDKSGQLTLNDIIADDKAQQFKPVKPSNKVIYFSQSNSTFWLKLVLNRTEEAKTEWVLDIQNKHLDEITFYGFNAQPIKTGDLLPFATRPYAYRFFAFPMSVDTQSHPYYLKLKSSYLLSIPLIVRSSENFFINNQMTTLIQAIYFGGTFVVSLFSCFAFLRTQDKKFLYYCLFVSLFSLAMFAKQGFARAFFWQELSYFDTIAQSFFSALCGLFSILFTREFIHSKNLSTKTDAFLKLIGFFYLLCAVLLLASNFFAIPSKPIFTVFLINSQLAAFIILFAITQAYRSGLTSLKLFFLAWSIFSLGLTVSNLKTFGMIPVNDFTMNVLQISSVFEIMLWSFAFINVFFEERKLKDAAQTQAIAAQKALIETQRNYQTDLEFKIKEKTRELEETIETEQLMRAKQLRFNALVSHELRNPLAIIESQATLILKEHAPTEDSLAKRITTIKSAIHRLLSLFDKWINHDRRGVMEQSLILSDVKIYPFIKTLFTKANALYPNHQFELMTDNANEQIIAVHQDWLEMVINNLIDNACKYSAPQSKIRLQCYQANGHTCIAVSDQGIGIDPAFHSQIFNEYYRVNETTQQFGLGLGLSLVKKIVDLHHAKIEVESTLNQGSTFRIIFPH